MLHYVYALFSLFCFSPFIFLFGGGYKGQFKIDARLARVFQATVFLQSPCTVWALLKGSEVERKESRKLCSVETEMAPSPAKAPLAEAL